MIRYYRRLGRFSLWNPRLLRKHKGGEQSGIDASSSLVSMTTNAGELVLILFLDFDGVLHPLEIVYSGPFPQFMIRKDALFCHLPRLESVVREQPGIEIVISSDWRFKETLEELRGHFSADIAARITGTTALDKQVNYRGDARYLEIFNWLRDNGCTHEAWVALDDCPGISDSRFVESEFMQQRLNNEAVVLGDDASF